MPRLPLLRPFALVTPLLWSVPALLTAGCSSDDDATESSDSDPNPTDSDEPVDCSTRPTDIPTARGEVEGAYSPERGQFVFFGGDEGVPVNCSTNTSMIADTWVFEEDCQNWRRIEDAGEPNPTARYAAGYDPIRDRFILHGGRFRAGTTGNYTLRPKTMAYSFETETWTALPTGPDARAIHAGTVAGDRFVIHGGTQSLSLIHI